MDTKEIKTPRTLLEAVRYFSNPKTCVRFLVAIRWPDGVVCPTCGSAAVRYMDKYSRWQCSKKHAKRQFSVKVGTVFEDSPLPLEKWLPVVWLLVNAKNGVSSYEVHRAIGVTQKTAWFMLHRVRLAMQRGTFDRPMGDGGGEIEADESFIGGKSRNMHKNKRAKKIHGALGGKEIVFGLLDRETKKVRVKHVPDRTRTTLHSEIKSNVAKGASLYTDDLRSYLDMGDDYEHDFVNHAESYVKGNVHTNGLENFWSLLKRGLKGTYVSVEPFHLFRYLDEQAFRYNERGGDDAARFVEALSAISGRRLTYKELTGKLEVEPTAAP